MKHDPHFALLLAAAFSCPGLRTGRRQAKNMIFFLGDGMGPTTMTAARIYKLQARTGLLELWRRLDRTARVKTYSQDAQTTDSAPSMGAYMTGVKMQQRRDLDDATPWPHRAEQGRQRQPDRRPLRRRQRHARRRPCWSWPRPQGKVGRRGHHHAS